MLEIGYGTNYIIIRLGYGGLSAYGDAVADRSDETSSWIEVWVDNAGSDIVGHSSTSYGFPITWGILTEGEEFYNNNVVDNGNKCLRNATLHGSGTLGSDYIYANFQHTSGTIYICFYCGQTGGCSQGYDTRNGSPHSEWVIVGRLDNPSYNPHSDPWLDIGSGGSGYRTRKQDSRTVDYNAGGDGHSLDVWLSTGDSFNVGAGGSGTKWFIPENCGQGYDATYTVYGTVRDTSSGVTINSRSNADMACYGSLRCSLGNIPSMQTGTAYSISVTAGADIFSNDDSHISYGVDIKKGSGNYTRYTISSDAGSGRNTYNGNYNFTPDEDGVIYTFRAWVRHNVSGDEWYSADKQAKTYVTPTVSDITGLNIFSPQDNATYSWTNNATNITNAGETPIQQITISSSRKDGVVDSSTSINLAPSGTYWVQSIFTDSTRSTDVLSSTLTVKLTNSASSVSVIKNKQFQVQYKPTKTFVITGVDNKGRTIAINKYPITNIKWEYPWNTGAAGVVSGFRIRVFSDSSYDDNKLVSTNYLSVNYDTYITGPTYSYDLDNATDLKRGVLNYADITAYYTYPSNGYKSYGTPVRVGSVVKPYKHMAKPVIAYPVNNKTWHNNGFRVLFALSKDEDYETYTSDIKNAYKYSDVEIEVNNTIYAFSGTYTGSTAHSEIFSTDVNKNNMNNHLKCIAINPSLVSGFPDVSDGSDFKIRVRVQRGNYYFTNQEMQGQDSFGTIVKTWSEWSDEITLNKSSIAPQNLAVGMEIKASHYQTVHNWGLRLLECYPLRSKDSGDIDQVRGNQIDGSQPHPDVGEYLGVYNTILNLMEGVNEYCTYERDAVKFNISEVFTPATEIITSAESGTDRYGSTGRNYINLLTRYMIDYLK